MKKRIFISIFSACTAILLTCLVIISGVLFKYFSSVQKRQLEDLCNLAAQSVEIDGIAYLHNYDSENCRITLVSQDGTVLYDSNANASEMENHLNREEITEAIKSGTGESERYSDTMLEKTMYYAIKLSDGNVIRTSVTLDSVWALLLGMLQPICFILFAVLIVSLVISDILANKLVKPLNMLNLDKPLENDTYDELSPLLSRIDKLHKELLKRMDELSRKQDEFYAVTEGMNEGLILLNNKNEIVSINHAAEQLFQVNRSCVGHEILEVYRSTTLNKLLEAKDLSNQTEITISGRNYILSLAPIKQRNEKVGVCLLTYDVTEKIQSERMRREFTSNVSHELKTPLHSIMGIAELMENGLMNNDDLPHFSGKIRNEAARLVALIDDIIRLSQLDDESSFPVEIVDLYALSAEVCASLSVSAKEHDVTLSLDGESTEITGVRCLLYEIVYNLCDNAIRYNRDKGSVEILVTSDKEKYILRVKDTGIGIPPEHRSRIFERFYRVDKSHSRECGGTGLGLSIVKHAVEYHHAKLSLVSETDKGTEITITFPKN